MRLPPNGEATQPRTKRRGRRRAEAESSFDVMDCDALIVGGGPAGLIAAVRAASRGRRVVLLERNRRPGIKILMSGGTHCNLTHATDARGVIAAFGPNGRFLHSALARFGPDDVRDFFAAEGVPTVVEEGGKVFPQSRRSADVLDALLAAACRAGAVIAAGETVESIEQCSTAGPHAFVVTTHRRRWVASHLLLATGGCSYPACGTRGDGYLMAERLGHVVVPPRPALAPLVSAEIWVRQLQGVSLADAEVAVEAVDRGSRPPDDSQALPTARHRAAHRRRSSLRPPRSRARGALLFTHFGLSGPAAMDVSREVSALGPNAARLVCDFLPQIPAADWAECFDEAIRTCGKRGAASLLARWLPQRLAQALALRAGAGDRRAAEIDRAVRNQLAAEVKQCRIALEGTRGFHKAEVTAGGVALDQIDPRTMESRIAPGVFFAGELLDLDGPIGGFNFQAAFSTGFLAGEHL